MLNRGLHALPWWVVIVGCLTLGLAPFNPPDIYLKLQMLRGDILTQPVDILEFCFHAFPWLILLAKATQEGMKRFKENSDAAQDE